MISKIKIYYKDKKFAMALLLVVMVILACCFGGTCYTINASINNHPISSLSDIPMSGLLTLLGLKYTLYSLPVFLLIYILLVSVLANKYTKDERNFTVSDKGTYGTADYLTKKESLTLFQETKIDNTTEDILGIYPDSKLLCSRRPDLQLNKMKIVCGNPGTWKSRAIVKPDIYQNLRRGHSMIVVDTKGDLYNTTAQMAKEMGYYVKLFNLVDLVHSDSCNFMADIGSDILKGQEFVWIIMANILEKPNSADFWDQVENNLFLAVTMFICADPYRKEDDKNIAEVYKYIATKSLSKIISDAKSLSDDHPAYAPFSIFLEADKIVQQGAKTGIATKLQIFQSKQIRDITRRKDIDFTLPGKQKCVYYVLISDQKSTFKLLSSLFFSYSITSLVEYADAKPDQKLDVPVSLILDEFCNVGFIDGFTTRLNTVRSRGISITIIIQDIGQLKDTYGDKQAASIISACDTNIFLGGNEIDNTASYYSQRSGIMTIEVESERFSENILSNKQFGYGGSQSLGKRNLMNEDEVLRLDNSELLVFMRGKKPLKLKKYDFLVHPLFDPNKSLNSSQYIPTRVLEEEKNNYGSSTPTNVPEPIERNENGLISLNQNKSKKKSKKKSTKQSDNQVDNATPETAQPQQPFPSDVYVDVNGEMYNPNTGEFLGYAPGYGPQTQESNVEEAAAQVPDKDTSENWITSNPAMTQNMSIQTKYDSKTNPKADMIINEYDTKIHEIAEQTKSTTDSSEDLVSLRNTLVGTGHKRSGFVSRLVEMDNNNKKHNKEYIEKIKNQEQEFEVETSEADENTITEQQPAQPSNNIPIEDIIPIIPEPTQSTSEPTVAAVSERVEVVTESPETPNTKNEANKAKKGKTTPTDKLGNPIDKNKLVTNEVKQPVRKKPKMKPIDEDDSITDQEPEEYNNGQKKNHNSAPIGFL